MIQQLGIIQLPQCLVDRNGYGIKISGTCGRLMCCLKYEQDAYEDLIRTSPKLESFVDTAEGRGTVVEIDLLRQRVKVRMEDSPETISVFANADVAVLRSGKAKKTDPPIPADLAPLSGGGKRKLRFQDVEEEKPLLEPIRFRYSTEKVVEEPAEEPAEQMGEPQEESGEAKSSRSRSRRRRHSEHKDRDNAPRAEEAPAKQEKPKKEPKAAPEKVPAGEEAAAPEGESEKKAPRRRPNHRRRKPKPSGDAQ